MHVPATDAVNIAVVLPLVIWKAAGQGLYGLANEGTVALGEQLNLGRHWIFLGGELSGRIPNGGGLLAF